MHSTICGYLWMVKNEEPETGRHDRAMDGSKLADRSMTSSTWWTCRYRFLNGAGALENFGIPRRPDGPRGGEANPVNWRRGLIRVWLLISGAWIMGWSIFLVLEGIQGGFETPRLAAIPILLVGPPIGLLSFGIVAGWPFRGFRTENRPS
jgi:hypothetical protein